MTVPKSFVDLFTAGAEAAGREREGMKGVIAMEVPEAAGVARVLATKGLNCRCSLSIR